MERMGDGRRRFLKRVGAAATVGTVLSAGCTSNTSTGSPSPGDENGGTTETTTDPDEETSGTTTTGSVPDADYPSSRWVPSPGSITDVASFAVGQQSTGVVRNQAGKMGDDAGFSFTRTIDSRARWFGIDAGKIETIVKFGPPEEADPNLIGMNVVLETTYDEENLISAIKDEGASAENETYEGYSFHRMSGRTVAVKGGTIVACLQTGGISATNLAKRAIDTSAGGFPSYYGSLALYRRGRERLGNVDVGRVVTHDPEPDDDPANGVFPESMTEGLGWRFSANEAEVHLVTVFSRTEHADADLIREFAESAAAFDPIDYSVSTEGTMVELTGTVAYDEMTGDVPYPPAFQN